MKKGEKMSLGQIEKIRQANLGRTSPMKGRKMLSGAIEKIRQARLGMKFSSEHIEGLRRSHLGKKHTIETREKMRYVRQGCQTGAKSKWWRGGITLKNSGLRKVVQNLFEYIHWRRQVFLRDNFTCQGCGATMGAKIVAHHIDEFQNIIDRFGITTAEQAVACESLWRVDNGVTLCWACHRIVHRQKKDNEMEWLNMNTNSDQLYAVKR